MATFFTAAEDSQREVIISPMSKNKKKTPTKYLLSAFIAVGNFVGIHQVTAARMMIP